MTDTRTVRGTMDELKTLTDAAYQAGYAAGVAAEREACAAVCVEHAAGWEKYQYRHDQDDPCAGMAEATARDCADAIRSRAAPGQPEPAP